MSVQNALIPTCPRADGLAIAMLNLHPSLAPLPQNTEVHLRLRWHRLLGLPLLTPSVVVERKRLRR